MYRGTPVLAGLLFALLVQVSPWPGRLASAQAQVEHTTRTVDVGVSALAEAQPVQCTVRGPAQQYAATAGDFGPGGSPYTAREDQGYYSDRGYLIGFVRDEWESFESSPWGGYLFTGVVLAPDGMAASADLHNAVNGWTQGWKPFESGQAPAIGHETVVLQRQTPWEIEPEQPMTEVFLAFRHCNASAHILVAVMPRLDPMAQAVRYAQMMLTRMQS